MSTYFRVLENFPARNTSPFIINNVNGRRLAHKGWRYAPRSADTLPFECTIDEVIRPTTTHYACAGGCRKCCRINIANGNAGNFLAACTLYMLRSYIPWKYFTQYNFLCTAYNMRALVKSRRLMNTVLLMFLVRNIVSFIRSQTHKDKSIQFLFRWPTLRTGCTSTR
jgi:hypothetical protein